MASTNFLNVNQGASKATTSTDSTIIPGPKIERHDFPIDFKFGCSTSAIQTEGSGDEGGRGPSILDSLIQDGKGGKDIAADSYHRYKEDVQLLKNMGVDTYRFSISWSRLLPDGTLNGGINQVGIDFYNNLINELLKYGITPLVTIFHFDLPQKLQDKYKGFLTKQIVDDFRAYANLCFKTYGDRVKHWITVNEPQIFSTRDYYRYGMDNPDAHPSTDPFVVVHNMMLCHAEAANLYKTHYQATQGGEVGISIVIEWFKPLTQKQEDVAAAYRAFDFQVGWVLEPLISGDYPFTMKSLVRENLPKFSTEEKALLQSSFDFIGCNYYTSRYASALPFNPNVQDFTSSDQFWYANITVNNMLNLPIGLKAPGSDEIYLYPEGLRDALEYIKEHYQDPKIYITENGYPGKRDDKIPLEVALQDDARIQHILTHLNALKEAMNKGVNVQGYIMWALLDCMEFKQGYKVRYGLNYTDYLNNLNRTPKKSAIWFNSWIHNGTTNPTSSNNQAGLKRPSLRKMLKLCFTSE